jgi:hypothetical protein
MDRDLRFKVKFHALPLFRTHKVMLESDVRLKKVLLETLLLGDRFEDKHGLAIEG